jgi:pimeloyl-ACP methyl ester carboxylesterase
VEVSDAGHCVPEERPGTFARLVREFFEETGGYGR